MFGCPGWLEGLIHANAFIKSGIAKTCLVIGAETLSRVIGVHDRASMIYYDGAGAVIIQTSTNKTGIKSHLSASHTLTEKDYLNFGKSYNLDNLSGIRDIKMGGRKIYEFALSHVPAAMKKCFDESGYQINKLNKIIIHQANEKMDDESLTMHHRMEKLFYFL
jgi:3-oxoacyl-[acyl-carrier-protein] synthase-3